MAYELGFEAEPIAGARTFNEFEAEDTGALEEWQGETAQEGPQRVRWIQASLNKILGLRLKVDGIMGPQTRSAIRGFQTTRGLGTDGIVGERTATALGLALSKSKVAVPVRLGRPVTASSGVSPRLVFTQDNYTQCDFIDPRIDVSAQYALYNMLRGDAKTRQSSLEMLGAVKGGQLGGIYQEDQRAPSLRAIALGLKWWGPLIETYRRDGNQLAVCVPPVTSTPDSIFTTLPGPQDRVPIIAFRKSLAEDITRLGKQLKTAWSQCGLSPLSPPEPSGVVCPRRPPVSKRGSLAIKVVQADGRPIKRALVILKPPPYSIQGPAEETDPEGYANFGSVETGKFRVEAHFPDYLVATEYITIDAGKSKFIRLVLTRQNKSDDVVEGKVHVVGEGDRRFQNAVVPTRLLMGKKIEEFVRGLARASADEKLSDEVRKVRRGVEGKYPNSSVDFAESPRQYVLTTNEWSDPVDVGPPEAKPPVILEIYLAQVKASTELRYKVFP